MDKVLVDIEKLKDANREMKYTNGVHLDKAVVGLLMFVNGEIKELVCNRRWQFVYAASVKQKNLF